MREFRIGPFNRWVVVCLVALAGCGGGGGGGPAGPQIIAPDSVTLGQALAWSVMTDTGRQVRASVYDESDRLLYHRDYESETLFQWTPFETGLMFIRAEIDGSARGEAPILEAVVEVVPRGGPMVTNSPHPWVALYSYTIPIGFEGSVRYTCDSCDSAVVARAFETPRRAGTGTETGVLLPGLRPGNDYSVQHFIYDGTAVAQAGPVLQYRSSSTAASGLQDVVVLTPQADPAQNSLLAISGIRGNRSLIVDELGMPVWYQPVGSIYRPTGSGWTIREHSLHIFVADYSGQPVRDLWVPALNLQLAELGVARTQAMHHDVRPLPGGRFAVLGHHERLFNDVQGPGVVDIIGDQVFVLNDRMQVVWSWDGFDHLDVSRAALLGDTLTAFGETDLELAEIANDWTHMNAIEYDPSDGNLLLSVRHQDWVVKIAYEDGTGDGHVVWRLGPEGDFAIVAADPNPWFSYPHDPNLLPDGRLAVYDNGNARVEALGGNSRGQVYSLDEVKMVATLDVNIDLGVYSFFLGSASQTPDGSFHFNTGDQRLHDTVLADGTVRGSFNTLGEAVYRSFVMRDPFDTSPN